MGLFDTLTVNRHDTLDTEQFGIEGDAELAAVIIGTVFMGVGIALLSVFLTLSIALGIYSMVFVAAGFGVLAAIGAGLIGLFTDVSRDQLFDSAGVATSNDIAASSPVESEEQGDVTDALETLRQRYARGELSDDTFERKLEALLETDVPEDARRRARRTTTTDAIDDRSTLQRERN